MDFDLTAEQELIRDTVRSFARDRVAPVAAELDLEGRFPYELVAELAELGLMGLPIPEEYGGAGGDTVSYAIAIEELTRIDSSVAITVAAHTSLGTMPILLFGTRSRSSAGCPTSPPGSGSPRSASPSRGPAPTRGTRGRRRSSATARGYQRLEALHHQRGHGHHLGRHDHRAHGRGRDPNIVVENGAPGYTISAAMKKLGWRASDTRELSFEDATVPEENLLGTRGDGFSQFLEILDGGRISVAAMGVGLAQGALTSPSRTRRSASSSGSRSRISRRCSSARRHGDRDRGRPRAGLPRRLAEGPGPRVHKRGGDGEALHRRALGPVAGAALQIHGGFGYMEESAISRLYRDQKILEIGEGTNEVQRMVIARQLGL